MDPKEIDREFGTTVRMARIDAGLSQEELASRIVGYGFEMSQATVGKVERGDRKVTIGEAEAFARALDRPLTVLMRGRDGVTETVIHERLLGLRNDLEEALRAHQMGQQIAAMMLDDLGEVSDVYDGLITHLVLESQTDIVRKIADDNRVENEARVARDHLYAVQDGDDRVPPKPPQTQNEGSLYSAYVRKFGDEVPTVIDGRAVEIMMGRTALSEG